MGRKRKSEVLKEIAAAQAESYTAEDVAQFVAAHAGQMATMARKVQLEALAYILAMAEIEANSILARNQQALQAA